MNILLVNPPNAMGKSYVVIPNLGLAYLASSLVTAGHRVSILDCVKDHVGRDGFSSLLRKHRYDVVGFCTFSSAVSTVKEYARTTREILPAATIALGGPHPTFEPEQTLQSIPDADFAFLGEAEETLPRLLSASQEKGPGPLENLAVRVPGLAWREEDHILKSPQVYVQDLDKNGIPAWDLVRPDTYPVAPNGIFSRSRHVAPIVATRGCPFPCTFCGAGKALGKKVRKRSIENLMQEVDLLTGRYGIREIHIMDDNFTYDAGHAAGFCEALMQRDHKLHWALPNGVRLDSLNRELLTLMERSGCYSFAVGIESGTQHVLDHIKKHLSLATIEEKIRLVKRVTAIRVTGFFILGYPMETRQDMEETIALSMKLPIDRANFFNFTPFPGSEIYERLRADGSMPPVNLDNLYIHNISYSPPGISRKEMVSYPRKAHLKFYLRPKILWGILREIRSLDQLKVIWMRARAILFQRLA